MWRYLPFVLISALFGGCGGSSSEPAKTPVPHPKIDFKSPPSPKGGAGGINARLVLGDLKEPTYVTGVPGQPGVLLVMERRGVISVVRGGARLPKPFLDLSSEVTTEGGEQGMFSIAF